MGDFEQTRDARVVSFSLSIHALRISTDYHCNANHDCFTADIPVEMFPSKHYDLISSRANILAGHKYAKYQLMNS